MLFVHVLRNALIPILTLIGLSISYIFSGALITEALFNYPGMGSSSGTRPMTQDYPVILGVIVVDAALPRSSDRCWPTSCTRSPIRV